MAATAMSRTAKPSIPTKIRPIWLDDELYCMHRTVDIEAMRTELTGTNSTANFGKNYVYAEAIIQTLLYAREKYKGSGNPTSCARLIW